MSLKIVNFAALVSGFLVISGCATGPTLATQEVNIPIAVSCVRPQDLPKKPIYKFDKLAADAADGTKVLALATDWLVGRKYEGELEAIITGCVEVPLSNGPDQAPLYPNNEMSNIE